MISSKTILNSLPQILKTIDLPNLGKKYQGKVRDIYFKDNKRILITTDRHTSFDVFLGLVPFKGTVLNLLSEFWFEKTKHIIPNHMISVPDPNVMITKNCEILRVEMVVRGYISGVSKTGLWYNYSQGRREIYGMKFPEELKKNQKLKKPIITPTTHPEIGSKIHDEMLTRDEILKNKLVDKKLYEQMEQTALKLFDFGSKWCLKKGLILVDTKYEFALFNGKLILIDEIHTPDSSRFWVGSNYRQRFEKGLEPEYYDKEFLRIWYAKKGYRGDGPPPKLPKDLIVQLSQRYIGVYEKLTGQKFKAYDYPIEERIKKNLQKAKVIL
ncbi:MAG TPA: phosphoribosylaminoimidazolesuccinocarboxamide synthase [Xanthomonadales bacterium]|nr:phosphoribosylaminoimidazolesuccinocarboxamide synthase [Xanthomonadales bacterium]